MFNECLFHLCVCTCSNVMCVCSTICGSNQKRFQFFLFAYGSDLYHPCFAKLFKLFLCEKHVFWVLFVTHFMSKLRWELNGPILKFFNFRQSFAIVLQVRLTCKNSQLSAKITKSAFLRVFHGTFVLNDDLFWMLAPCGNNNMYLGKIFICSYIV